MVVVLSSNFITYHSPITSSSSGISRGSACGSSMSGSGEVWVGRVYFTGVIFPSPGSFHPCILPSRPHLAIWSVDIPLIGWNNKYFYFWTIFSS